MQNLYPLFERNRILKKEMLWALRDYSFMQARLDYEEYADGILRGCEVRVEGNRILAGPGIIKYGGFICLMDREESVEYAPCDEYVSVKMRFQTERAQEDCHIYEMELVTDSDTARKDNVFELFRYKLQEGAALRDRHTDLLDMATEYNTLNYLYATWGGLRENSMAPAVTGRFAREILAAGSPRTEDIGFAYLCLSQPGAVPMEILRDYLGRGGKDISGLPMEEIFHRMCRVISRLGGAGISGGQEKTGRKRIIVD